MSDTGTTISVRRNWSAEYPELVKNGFREFHMEKDKAGVLPETRVAGVPITAQEKAIECGYLSIQKVRLNDVIKYLAIKRDSLSPTVHMGAAYGDVILDYRCILDEKTVVFVRFLSDDDARKNEEGYVSATLVAQTQADRNLQEESVQVKGTVDAFELIRDHFKQDQSGKWVRGGICVGEVTELFRLERDKAGLHRREEDLPPHVSAYKNHQKNLPPDTCRLGLFSSEILMQLPVDAQKYTLLKDLPEEMMTTVTVPYATPTRLFEADTSLTQVLLNAGFEHQKGGEFVKRDMNYGTAKSFVKNPSSPSWVARPPLKWLKPQMYSFSRAPLGHFPNKKALFVFESQETSPTWSDNSKVDVFVYMSPQVDEVVKGLLRKKP